MCVHYQISPTYPLLIIQVWIQVWNVLFSVGSQRKSRNRSSNDITFISKRGDQKCLNNGVCCTSSISPVGQISVFCQQTKKRLNFLVNIKSVLQKGWNQPANPAICEELECSWFEIIVPFNSSALLMCAPRFVPSNFTILLSCCKFKLNRC